MCMDDLNKKIGYEMRSQRLLARMTLEQVALGMGYKSKNTISRMELGQAQITVQDLISFCEVVGCSWADLLYRVSDDAGV